MRLEQRLIHIKNVEFSNENRVENGVLFFNKEEIIQKLMEHPNVKDIKIDIARPGEKTRIIPVKDVIEPRVKIEGNNGFAGVTTKVAQLGYGKVNVLKNVAVVTIGDIVGFQEGVVDM